LLLLSAKYIFVSCIWFSPCLFVSISMSFLAHCLAYSYSRELDGENRSCIIQAAWIWATLKVIREGGDRAKGGKQKRSVVAVRLLGGGWRMAEPERVSTAVNGSWVSRSRRPRHLAKGGTSRGLKLRLVKQWVFRPLFSCLCSYLERSSCVIFLGGYFGLDLAVEWALARLFFSTWVRSY
jgi:hypothetical protein